MLILGAQTEPGGAAFLLVWSVLALIAGGVLATKKGSGGMRSFVVQGLEGSSRQQRQAKAVPAGFLRALGGFFVLAGTVALIASVIMLTGS
ncbi:hypothetical protein [Streptomyces sp. TR06-5]|uniref:hypothetical protein n=1 Tax=Streptomyces sp. TR06-5 TaxID=3385976 RepID=UPI0039A194FA